MDDKNDDKNHTFIRKLLALGFVGGLALAFAACGDDDDDTASGGESTTTEADAGGDPYGNGATTTAAEGGGGGGGGGATLAITAIQYSDVSAPAGGTLNIENSSGAPHTFTSDDDAFESVDVAADGSATATVPGEPGDYPFHCEIHPDMQATLTVE
jgi:plastocyanin